MKKKNEFVSTVPNFLIFFLIITQLLTVLALVFLSDQINKTSSITGQYLSWSKESLNHIDRTMNLNQQCPQVPFCKAYGPNGQVGVGINPQNLTNCTN